MNENPEGTPNPLNPSPNSAPQTETLGAVTEKQPIPVGRDVIATTAPKSTTTPESHTTNTGQIISGAPAQYPAARPMEKAPEPEPVAPKKKKTGLIVGAIICGVVALGCVIAAIVVALTARQTDPVARAVEKIVSGNAPTNTAIDGVVKINANSTSSSDVKNANITLSSQISNSSMINSTTAKIDFSLTNGSSFSIEASEVYAANGDLYLKIDGLSNLLNPDSEAMENTYLSDDVASSSSYDSTLALTSMLSGMVQKIDGTWLKISTDDLESIASMNTSIDSDTTCVVNMFKSATENTNTLSGIYNKYPFITSTDENVPVASQKDPVYRVTLDSENFTGFMEEAQNTDSFREFATCMGHNGENFDIDEVMESLSEMPAIYVEVDGDYNFTRVYFVAQDEDEGVDATFDLGLSYPANINVSEPVEHKSINELMQEIMTSMNLYDTQVVEPDKTVTE